MRDVARGIRERTEEVLTSVIEIWFIFKFICLSRL